MIIRYFVLVEGAIISTREDLQTVRSHINLRGFFESYVNWIHHGEPVQINMFKQTIEFNDNHSNDNNENEDKMEIDNNNEDEIVEALHKILIISCLRKLKRSYTLGAQNAQC